MVNASRSFVEALYGDSFDYSIDLLFYHTLEDAIGFPQTAYYWLLNTSQIRENGVVIESTACSEDEFPVGKCLMRKFTVTAIKDDLYDQFDFVGSWIVATFNGEVFGRFMVYSQDYDSSENLVLTCYDSFCFLDAPFTGATTPISAYALIRSIEQMVGWTGQDDLFFLSAAEEQEFRNRTYSSVPASGEATCREVVEYVLQTFGYNLSEYFGNDAYFYITYPNVSYISIPPVDEYTAQQHGYDLFRYLYSLELSHKDIQVNGVEVVYNDPTSAQLVNTISQSVASPANVGFKIRIEGNPLINTATEATACATSIMNRYGGAIYRKANFTHLEDPRLIAGDIGLVLGTDGEYYPIILSHTRYQVHNRQQSYSSAPDTHRNKVQGYSTRTSTVNEAYNYSKVHSDANATLIATLQTDVGNVGTRVTALEAEDFWYVQRCNYEYTCPASGSVNVTKNQLDVSIPTGFTIIGYTSISTANADVVPRSWNAQATPTGASIVLRNLTSAQKTGTLTVDVLSMKTSRQQP